MGYLKHILLFGAGKSATVLIDYLKQIATEKGWKVTIADYDLETVNTKIGEVNPLVVAKQIDIKNKEQRMALIGEADVVISMMPHSFHDLIAFDCIELNKHLLTASYVSDDIKARASEIRDRNLLFLCEMGLDPGIDHMSAMKLFNRIKEDGGKVTSFKSHCGGLISPQSDDNPWHYKISWNPRNIILAGKAGALYKENGNEIRLLYEELFDSNRTVEVPECSTFAYYPNRDSLGYISLYGLDNAHTFIRTTLRHPEFCSGWKTIIDLQLTDEEKKYETDGMSVGNFFKQHFENIGFSNWFASFCQNHLNFTTLKEEKDSANSILPIELAGFAIPEGINKPDDLITYKINETSQSINQLLFLGLNDATLINMGLCSAADVLQFILEKKLALKSDDKDMIVMMHEIEYKKENELLKLKSSLVVKGVDSIKTAMAKTVGLPLGIAAKCILEGVITERGLQIPLLATIYEPILKELEKYDISFIES